MYTDFAEVIADTGSLLKRYGSVVKANKWQARDVSLGMWEVLNHMFICEVNPDIEELKKQIKPSLPWADEHFAERVSGLPLNPPPSYVNWPYYKQDEKWKVGDKFSHSYPERMWPPLTIGIRYAYGDLGDLIQLLLDDPYTRQAFLPIWFPEDTGAVHGERVPCTIGYYFILRNNRLNMIYPIRSCDYRRHFRNDIYMACRLLLWVLDELKESDPGTWRDVKPGTLTMQIWNLHVFEGEQNFI